mgnify:CR=1 FL=1
MLFQSTHPARDATMRRDCFMDFFSMISIHASREGCDQQKKMEEDNKIAISIHASREGCDVMSTEQFQSLRTFQSTHPARDATYYEYSKMQWHRISIHASREGCDQISVARLLTTGDFNPRIPRGMRPVVDPPPRIRDLDFNPRIPRGMRHKGRIPCRCG